MQPDNEFTAIDTPVAETGKEIPMNIHLNRLLDLVACIAITAIGLTLGGATAVLGA